MVKIRPIEYNEIEKVSKMAIKFITEPKVSDGNIILCEENRKYWLELASNILSKDRNSIIIAELNDEITGYAMFNLRASEPFKVKYKWAYISDIYVEPEHRMKGIGKEMINYIEDQAKKSDVKKIRLIVWIENENAIRFYEKLGFKKIGYLLEKDI